MKNIFRILVILLLIDFVILPHSAQAQGVTLVKDITPGASGTFNSWGEYGIYGTVANKLFTYSIEEYKTHKLWATNIEDLSTQLVYSSNSLSSFYSYGDNMFFVGVKSSKRHLLKVLEDNTAKEIYSTKNYLGHVVGYNGDLYFADKNILIKYKLNDGSIDTIFEFNSFAGIKDMTATSEGLILIGSAPSNGHLYLYKSDGTTGGTVKYHLINDGSDFNRYIYMTAVDTKVFFFYKKSGDVYRLWVTDGTSAGTKALVEYDELAFEDLERDKSVYGFDGKFYFRGDGADGDRLYVSDGTISGTKVIDKSNAKAPKNLIDYDNKVYLFGRNSWWNFVCYYTTGQDLTSTFGDYNVTITPFQVYKEKLLFCGRKYSENENHYEIFAYDKSNGNIAKLTSMSSDDHSYLPRAMSVSGEMVFFIANSPEYGSELFVYNYTADPIVINSQPQSITVCEGETAYFAIEASTSAKNFQWQKDGKDIAGATSDTLILSGVSSADAGIYTCIVSNDNNSVTSDNAILTVNAATEITKQPESKKLCIGESVVFDVKANGENITYQWQKDNEDLSNENTSTLTIANISSDDEGNYKCVVKGLCGTVSSDEATLTINAPIQVTTQPQSQDVKQGENVTFSIAATGAISSYQWQKDDSPISDGGKYSGTSTSELTISSVSTAEKGNYSVKVSGACGDVISDAATLNVTTAVLDLEKAGVSIVPNPAKDYIHIINKGNKIDRVTIYNTSGKKILEQTKNIDRIDISNINTGVYFVKVVQGKDVGLVRILVER